MDDMRFPHSTVVIQDNGTLNFTPLPGPYGYGWQQVPDWADGTYFWMSSPAVDNGRLYILGQRIKGNTSGQFEVINSYIAEFDPETFTFIRAVALPNGRCRGVIWGGIAKSSTWWIITGTHSASGTIRKVGDIALAPPAELGSPQKWTVLNNVALNNADIGTNLSLVKSGRGWDIFTKLGDFSGGDILRLSSKKINGPWETSGALPP